MDASGAMEGALGAAILGYFTVGVRLGLRPRRGVLCAKKPDPRGSGLKRALSQLKQCDREGPDVGFPPLTHGRIAVRNWVQNTCSTLPSQLAVVLGATSDVFGTCRGQGVRPIHD